MASTATDDEINAAIEEHRAWMEKAAPSADVQPRVIVEFCDRRASRRPFRRKGHWSVRWQGTARLTAPRLQDGVTIFTADYGRP